MWLDAVLELLMVVDVADVLQRFHWTFSHAASELAIHLGHFHSL